MRVAHGAKARHRFCPVGILQITAGEPMVGKAWPRRRLPIIKEEAIVSRDDFGDTPKYCKHCGGVSIPRVKTVKEGSALVGIFLLLLMILPGLLYFIFRMRTDSFWVCGKCGRRGGLIPTDSPIAQVALKNQGSA